MAEDLDDGEFWLPSHFLTDDDILMDFDFSAPKHGGSFSVSASASDLDFTSGCTETESDEDDIQLAGLTHKMTRSNLEESSCPVHSKGWVLSTSPQSTLCGCMCNQSSSRESGSGPESPPPPPPPPREAEDKNNTAANNNDKENNNNNATLDLLNKAAGEVARLKMRTEKTIGTGFFDCSQKGVSYPPPLTKTVVPPPLYYQPQFLHFPPVFWAPSNGMQYIQPKQQPPQNRATKNNNKNNSNKSNNNSQNSNSNRPLGLPPSAWPPLQAQVQAQPQPQPQAQPQPKAQTQAQPIPPMFVGPKSAGTGVFLPRRVATPANESRKKSDGNTTKSKTGKGSNSQSNNRRNSGKTSTTTTTVNHNDIQLPQEWIY